AIGSGEQRGGVEEAGQRLFLRGLTGLEGGESQTAQEGPVGVAGLSDGDAKGAVAIGTLRLYVREDLRPLAPAGYLSFDVFGDGPDRAAGVTRPDLHVAALAPDAGDPQLQLDLVGRASQSRFVGPQGGCDPGQQRTRDD